MTSEIVHKFQKKFLPQGISIYDNIIEIFMIFLIIFSPLTHGAVEPWSIAVLQLTAAIVFIFWLGGQINNGKFVFAVLPVFLFIFILIAYICLQLFFSIIPADNVPSYLPGTVYAWATRSELLKVIAYTVIFFCTINTIKTRAQITRILSVVIVTGLMMSFFSLMRYFKVPAPRGYINPDHFAGYLGMIIPLAIGFLLAPSADRHRDAFYAKRSLLYYLIAVMGAALFFTMSRGGMLSFVLALIFMACLIMMKKASLNTDRLRTLLIVAVFIIFIIAWMGMTPVLERLLSIKVEVASLYFAGRLPLWKSTLNIINSFPVFGSGFGTFTFIFPVYQPALDVFKRYAHAHGDYIELLSDTGAFGLLIFLCAAVLCAYYLLKCFRKRRDPWVIAVSSGLLGSLVSIFFHSFTDFNMHIPGNAFLMITVLALTIIVLNWKEEKKEESVIYNKIILHLPSFKSDRKKYNIPLLIFYIVIFLLPLLYTVSIIRPAIADYYYRKSLTPESASHDISSNIDSINKAIALDPGNAEYPHYLGRLYYDKYVQSVKFNLETKSLHLIYAMNEYKKAVKINPLNSNYHRSLAWGYGQLAKLSVSRDNLILLSFKDNHRNAISEFVTSIKLDPNNPYTHRLYAIWLYSQPSKEYISKADSEYKTAISLKPELIVEAVENSKKASGKLFKVNKLMPESDNKKIYSVMAKKLKEAGYKKEAEEVSLYIR